MYDMNPLRDTSYLKISDKMNIGCNANLKVELLQPSHCLKVLSFHWWENFYLLKWLDSLLLLKHLRHF